jgi:anti-sigma factor RsiW
MIEYQDQLKLQAYLDGELPAAEAQAVANRLERDREAAALLTELRQTREVLAGFDREIKLPETREFFWSKIQREIERQERPVVEPLRAPWLGRLRRYLVPAAAVALLGIAVLTMLPRSSNPFGVETTLQDSGAFTYHDETAGATLVWLSYPADN